MARKARVRWRRDTSAILALRNKIYGAGEPIWTTDDTILKIADGVTPYNSLPSYDLGNIGGGGGGVGTVTEVAGVGPDVSGDIPLGSLRTALSISNVNNTSDANKPISTLTQGALDALAASLASHQHPSSQISDSTPLGRSLLTAANAAAARSAISAAPATGISMDATADSATRLAMTAAERTKLATLTNQAIVLTDGAAVPPGLPDPTPIIRYAATVPATPTFTSVGTAISTAATTTVVVTTTADIPVGDTIGVALVRGATGTSTGGTAAVTLSSGAVDSWTSKRASAQRTGVCEVDWLNAKVTTLIPSGTTVTITTTGNFTNRVVALVGHITGVDTTVFDATSGDDAAGINGAVSAGQNASASSLAISTDDTTADPNCLVIGLWGYNASVTWSVSGDTSVGSVVTSAGSSERGLLVGYKVATSTGIQTMTATGSASGAVAGVIVALPLAMVAA